MARPHMVYIVDDDRIVQKSIDFFLGTAEFDTRLYLTGRDFISDADHLAPGCVLLDVRMPGMDGLQVIEALGERLVRLPVIVMTGHGDVATAVRAMKLGASDFLEKPFEETALLDALEQVFAALDARSRAGAERAEAEALVRTLTMREADVLRGLMAGMSNKMLANRLGLSVRTVEMHRAKMMERLQVSALSDALRIAFSAGMERAWEGAARK